MSVVAADLERSGLFRPVDKRAFIQDAASLRLGPRFGDWRLINAEALVSGNVELQADRSEEHTSELQSLMRISYAVFCLKKKKKKEITDIRSEEQSKQI